MGFIENIERWVPDLKKRNILDVGCGRGALLLTFAERGYRVTGFDRNSDYLDTVAKRAQELGLRVNTMLGSAEQMPCESGSYDFLVCNEVTEHVEDLNRLVAECARVLGPAGCMYISFHNRWGAYDHHYHLWFINWFPRRIADYLIALLGKSKGDSDKAGRQALSSMNYVNYSMATRLLKLHGFSFIDTRRERLFNHPFLSQFRWAGVPHVLWFLAQRIMSTFHFIAVKS